MPKTEETDPIEGGGRGEKAKVGGGGSGETGVNYSSATKLCLLSFPRGTFVLFLVAKLTNFFPLLEKNLSHFLRKSERVCAERIFECVSASVGAGGCMFG